MKRRDELLKLIFADEKISNPLEAMRKGRDGHFITNQLIKYFLKHPEVFQDYIKPFEDYGIEVGLRRHKNSIRLLTADFENEVIDNLNDVLFERFIEWRCLPIPAGGQLDSK